MKRLFLSLTILAAMAGGTQAQEQKKPRALIMELANHTSQPRQLVSSSASDTLALELTKKDVMEVIATSEILRIVKERHMTAPLSFEDAKIIARELNAQLIVTGDVRVSDIEEKDGKRHARVGIVVEVYSIPLEDEISGGAEYGHAEGLNDGKKPDGVLFMDAAISAATRVAQRIAAYNPIRGQVLNSSNSDVIVLNRGLGHGVQKRQEFILLRNGVKVGRAKASKVFPNYTELKVLDNSFGIQPQDIAIAVFPEPKLIGR